MPTPRLFLDEGRVHKKEARFFAALRMTIGKLIEQERAKGHK